MPSPFKPIVAALYLVFVLCFLPPNAHADSITTGTVNFTVLKGGPTPTGSFSFDNTTNTFNYFSVIWNGAFFPFDFLECNCDEASTFTLAQWISREVGPPSVLTDHLY